jgi:hypothetical protein
VPYVGIDCFRGYSFGAPAVAVVGSKSCDNNIQVSTPSAHSLATSCSRMEVLSSSMIETKDRPKAGTQGGRREFQSEEMPSWSQG